MTATAPMTVCMIEYSVWVVKDRLKTHCYIGNYIAIFVDITNHTHYSDYKIQSLLQISDD